MSTFAHLPQQPHTPNTISTKYNSGRTRHHCLECGAIRTKDRHLPCTMAGLPSVGLPGFITWSLSSSSPSSSFPIDTSFFFSPILLLSTCSYFICIIKFHDLQTTETYPSLCKQNGNWCDKEEEVGMFLKAVRMSRSQHNSPAHSQLSPRKG